MELFNRVQLGSMKYFGVAALVLAGVCAIAATARSTPLAPFAQADADAVLEGTMEVVIEDSDQVSRTLYFLIAGDGRVPLRFESPPPNLTTGARVRVHGRWADDGTLVVTSFERI